MKGFNLLFALRFAVPFGFFLPLEPIPVIPLFSVDIDFFRFFAL